MANKLVGKKPYSKKVPVPAIDESVEEITEESSQAAETKELIRKAKRLLKTTLSLVMEMQAILEALGAGGQRQRKAIDLNGEPTWEFQIRVPVPKDIYLTKLFRGYANEHGMKGERADLEFQKFRNYYQRTGKNWQSWKAVWEKWCRTSNDDAGKLIPMAPGNVKRPDHGAI